MDFVYPPIKAWQIRLLELFPGPGDSMLRGNLLAADVFPDVDGAVLHNEQVAIQFGAVSYHWDPPPFLHAILIGPDLVPISRSLSEALSVLRYPPGGGRVYVWADALCINQADNAGKSEQIQKMITIYNKAHTTLAYIGRSGEYTDLAIQHLRKTSMHPLKEVTTRNDRLRLFKGLSDLYSRPWCWRVWVQQEVFASRNIRVQCGGSQLSFSDYRRGTSQISRLGIELQIRAGPMNTKAIAALRRMSAGKPDTLARLQEDKTKLFQTYRCHCFSPSRSDDVDANPECILSKSFMLEAKNPRDYVYGLLNLMNCATTSTTALQSQQSKIPQLIVNYATTPAAVFADMTRYIIERDEHLDVLFEHVPVDTLKNDLGIPSWCPDWRAYQHMSGSYGRSWVEMIDLTESSRGPIPLRWDKYGLSDLEYVPFRVLTSTRSSGNGRSNLVHDGPQPLFIEGYTIANVASIRTLPQGSAIDRKFRINNKSRRSGLFSGRPELEPKFELEIVPAREVDIQIDDIVVAPPAASFGLDEQTSLQRAVLILRKREAGGYTFVAQAKFYRKNSNHLFSHLTTEERYEPYNANKLQTYSIE